MVLDIFTYADVAFAVLALIALISGLCKGFMSQLFGFASLAIAIIVALYATKPVVTIFESMFQPIYNSIGETLGYILACIIVFMVITLLVKIIVALINKFFTSLIEKVSVIKGIDKFLGMVLSLGIVYCVFGAVIGLLTLIPEGTLDSVMTTIDNQIYGGTILKALYSNNYIGDFVVGLISKGE